MNKMRLLLPLSVLMCACLDASPVACKPDTLTNYIALNAMGGCMVGGTLTFMSFGFSLVNASAGPTLATSDDVNVTPVTSTNEYGLKYASSKFRVTSGQFAQYLLTFTVDPLPPIIHGWSLDMDVDSEFGVSSLSRVASPTAPGVASVTSLECIGLAFVGSVCNTSTVTNMVSHNGVTPMLMDVKQFGPTNIVGDRTTITLDATGGGTANFTSLSEFAQTPEPANGMLVLAAAAGLWIAARRRSGAC